MVTEISGIYRYPPETILSDRVYLTLKPYGDDIQVCVVNERGETLGTIMVFDMTEGTYYRVARVPSELGFKLDKDGAIMQSGH
jgi:hypothetical protein